MHKNLFEEEKEKKRQCHCECNINLSEEKKEASRIYEKLLFII